MTKRNRKHNTTRQRTILKRPRAGTLIQLLERSKLDPQQDRRTPEGQDYHDIFEDLQGNILKGHDRDYASHIFIRFNCNPQNPDAQKIRTMIKERISKSVFHITSAGRQFRETVLYRRNKIRGKVFVSLFMTYTGYQALGLDEDVRFDRSFKAGMQGSRARLNDPPPPGSPGGPDASVWQGYKDDDKIYPRPSDIDAMILLADDDEEYLKRTELRVTNSVLVARMGDNFESMGGPIDKDYVLADVVTVQRGKQLRATNRTDQFNGHPIEHFGYLDGISNPLFLTTDEKRVKDFMGDYYWKPWAPLNLALVPDPHTLAGPHATGSYMVFRRLEQNVGLFRSLKANMARALGIAVTDDPSDPGIKIDLIDRAGALVIGRYKEGTPTSQTPPLLDGAGRYDPDGHPYQLKITNDFTYRNPINDSAGLNCPFHAHIRLANDRTDQTRQEHRIVRRGITYGERSEDLTDAPGTGVGLLFMCFQKNIRSGFEYIQRRANGRNPDNDDNAMAQDGLVDPIIGQINESDLPGGQQWPNQVGGNQTVPFRFTDVISLQGGEYFFAPSISFLRAIMGRGRPRKDDTLARSFAERGL